MPTNLPPEYFKIEKRYGDEQGTDEKIACLEEMMSVIPKHKGTDKLRADLRKRISKLKSADHSKKGATRKESAFNISKEGAGQVVVVGPANVGKSCLVSALTNASPEISNAPHSTWKPTPGMMPFKDIQIQLIDTPPLSHEYMEIGLLDLIRRSDLVLLMVDLQSDPFQQLDEMVKLLHDNRIIPLRLKEQFLEEKRNITFIPFHILANKNDDETSDEHVNIFCELLEDDWPLLSISATSGRNLNQLKSILFLRLNIIRVYSKTPGRLADMKAPFVLKKGDTVEKFAAKVHKDFVDKLKIAKIWGKDVYDGQMVQRDHILHDGDIVEIRI